MAGRPASGVPPAPSARTRVRRLADHAAYDRATIAAILDAMPVAHVGYVVDGAPVVTPTIQWREGERIFWHGSSASRMLRRAAGAPVCVTVTLTEGMSLARSGLEHTVHYRSVMLFGTATAVTDPAAKAAHLKAFMDRHFPGRWESLRPMTAQELKATAILSMPVAEASAKLSGGLPGDPAPDLSWPVWAGTVPIRLVTGAPVPDPRMDPAIPLPGYLRDYDFTRTGR